MKCEYCKKELQKLNPPVEEYVAHKFCLNIFGWRLMLYKDTFDYGCVDCMADEEQSRDNDMFNDAVSDAIAREIEKGNLILRD